MSATRVNANFAIHQVMAQAVPIARVINTVTVTVQTSVDGAAPHRWAVAARTTQAGIMKNRGNVESTTLKREIGLIRHLATSIGGV